MCRLETCWIAMCVLVTLGCNSLVPMVPSEAATAKAVVDQLTPGRTMTLTNLFDVTVREANSRHWFSRESFTFRVACRQSLSSVLVLAHSGPKWRDYIVQEIRLREASEKDAFRSGVGRTTGQVRAALGAIEACDSVMIAIGGEKIEATLDERWIIQRVTHEPILPAAKGASGPG